MIKSGDILVTEDMLRAGEIAALSTRGWPGDDPYQDHTIIEIYQAMEAVRRATSQSAPEGATTAAL